MRYVSMLATLAALNVSLSHAATVSLDLNEDVAHINVTGQPNPKALEFNAGLFHHDDDANQRRDDSGQIYYAGAVAKDPMTNFRDVEFNLGGQIGFVDADNADGGFAALTFGARYYLPDAKGVATALQVIYSPDVLSADRLDNLYGLTAEASWRIVPQGEIFGGYRRIKLEINDADDLNFEDSVFAGFRLQF